MFGSRLDWFGSYELSRDSWSRCDYFSWLVWESRRDPWSDLIRFLVVFVTKLVFVDVLGCRDPWGSVWQFWYGSSELMSWPCGLGIESLWLVVLAETQVGHLARVWRGKPNHMICIFDCFLLLILLLLLLWHTFGPKHLDGSRPFVVSTWYTFDWFGVVLTSMDLGTDCETVN